MKGKVTAATIAMMALACTSLADWPQYLGPDRNSTSPEKGISRSWPEGGPEVLWTVAVGRGYGGPAIKDGKVYLLDRDDQVGDNLRCFDLASGKERWHLPMMLPRLSCFPVLAAYRPLTATMYIRAATTAICIVLIWPHTGPSGRQTYGRISAANRPAASRADLDHANPAVFPSGPLRSVPWFTATCLL
jgi:hypothetical protein